MDTSLLQERIGNDIRITELLRQNGAEVFASARDLSRHVPVVLRALDLEANPTAGELRLFELQAAQAAGFRHLNIATAQPLQRRPTLVFYAMNVGFATMLESVLIEGSLLPFEQALDILRGVAAALDYAHSHGMVHGRLDPKLIFVDGDDVMVSGFIAVKDASSIGEIGPTTYAAPEQRAWRHEADTRADVYALGVLAFELISGRRVPDTPAASMSFGEWYTIPRDVPLRQDVSLHVNEAITRAISKRPSARFATAEEFIYALETAQPEPATVAPDEPPAPRAPQSYAPLLPVETEAPVRPKRVASAIGIGAFCVLGAFTVLSMRKDIDIPNVSSAIAGTLSRLTTSAAPEDSSLITVPTDSSPSHSTVGKSAARRRRSATAAIGEENGAISVPRARGRDSAAGRSSAGAARAAAGGGWMGILENAQFKIFVDTGASVQQTPSATKVWVRTDFVKPQRMSDNDSREFVSSLNHYKLNCDAGTTSVGPGAFYDARGTPIMRITSGYAPLQQPGSGTPAEEILMRVCAVLRARR